MVKEEDWEGYHTTFPELDLEGLTNDDESYYRILRDTKIDMFGDSLVKPERMASEDVLSSESAINAANEAAKTARGRSLELAREVKTLRRQLNVWESMYRNAQNQARGDKRVVDSILDRLPPHNLDLEMTILGLYMKRPGLMVNFNQGLLGNLFYADAHTRIQKTMASLNGKFDRKILEEALKQSGEFEAVGGSAYLTTLETFGETADPANIDKFIEIIEDYALRRDLIHWLGSKFRECYESKEDTPGEPRVITVWPEHIRRISADMLNLLPVRFQKRYSTPRLVDETVEDFKELVQRKGKPRISTGYKGLDRIMHGILPGRFVMVGARTKIGKTTVSLNIANNIAEQHYGSLIFTYESSRAELIQKLISKHSGVDSERFVYWDEDRIPEEEIEKILATAEFVKGLPIDFDASKPDIGYIIERTRHVKSMKPNLALVVVDGLQSFEGYIPYHGNKSDIYQDILQKLKALAVEQEVCVLVNAQLKLDIEKRKDKRPRGLEDFSDCKGIPEVADTAFCLYRPEFYWPENENYKGIMEVIPIVMRVGGKREKGFKLGCDMKTSRVYEISKS